MVAPLKNFSLGIRGVFFHFFAVVVHEALKNPAGLLGQTGGGYCEIAWQANSECVLAELNCNWVLIEASLAPLCRHQYWKAGCTLHQRKQTVKWKQMFGHGSAATRTQFPSEYKLRGKNVIVRRVSATSWLQVITPSSSHCIREEAHSGMVYKCFLVWSRIRQATCMHCLV